MALQAAQALSGNSDTQGGPNTVLRVIIEHMLYPITLDVLHQVKYVYIFHSRHWHGPQGSQFAFGEKKSDSCCERPLG